MRTIEEELLSFYYIRYFGLPSNKFKEFLLKLNWVDSNSITRD